MAEALEKFIKWFEKSYLLSREEAISLYGKDARAGAIHQLVRDGKRILAGELNGFKPKRILPVIVNPIDIVFSIDFYKMLDRAIEERDLLKGESGIIKSLILGLGDLEYVAAHDLNDKKLSLRNILLEKALHSAGRTSTWSLILKKLGMKYNQPVDIKTTFDGLTKKAVQLLELKE